MKRIIVLIFSVMMALSPGAHAQLISVEIRAIGLTCSMCSNAIIKQLETIQEIDSIRTDLNTSSYFITLKGGNILSPAVFKEKVERAGFFVGYFEATIKKEELNQPQYIRVDARTQLVDVVRFQVLDAGYVPIKELKKLKKELRKYETYGTAQNELYHIKILS